MDTPNQRAISFSAGQTIILAVIFCLSVFSLHPEGKKWWKNNTTVYLIHLSHHLNNNEHSLVIAKAVFRLNRCELTAWNYSVHLLMLGKPVPAHVFAALIQDSNWIYPELLTLNLSDEMVTTSVSLVAKKVNDRLLSLYLSHAIEAENSYSYWSRPEIQQSTIIELNKNSDLLWPLAKMTETEIILAGLEDFIKRQINGWISLFETPTIVDAAALGTRLGRRIFGFIDVISAIDTSASLSQQVEAAKNARLQISTQITYITSGNMLRELERDRASSRALLASQVRAITMDKNMYWPIPNLNLAVLKGRDANALFLGYLQHTKIATFGFGYKWGASLL